MIIQIRKLILFTNYITKLHYILFNYINILSVLTMTDTPTKIYFKSILDTTISYEAEELGPNIQAEMYNKVSTKHAKRKMGTCIVFHVIDIINFEYGICDRINFVDNVDYRCTFSAIIVRPVIDSVLIAKVIKSKVPGIYLCSSGPFVKLIIQIDPNSIDPTNITIINDKFVDIHNSRSIEIGAYVKCKVAGISFGKNKFVLDARLLDVATDDEVSVYLDEQEKLKNNVEELDSTVNTNEYL